MSSIFYDKGHLPKGSSGDAKPTFEELSRQVWTSYRSSNLSEASAQFGPGHILLAEAHTSSARQIQLLPTHMPEQTALLPSAASPLAEKTPEKALVPPPPPTTTSCSWMEGYQLGAGPMHLTRGICPLAADHQSVVEFPWGDKTRIRSDGQASAEFLQVTDDNGHLVSSPDRSLQITIQ